MGKGWTNITKIIQTGGDILTMCAFLYRWIVALIQSPLSIFLVPWQGLIVAIMHSIRLHPSNGDIRPSVTHNLHAISTYVRVIPTWPVYISGPVSYPSFRQGEHKGTVARHLKQAENAWCLWYVGIPTSISAALDCFYIFSHVPRLVIPLITLAARL